MPACWSREGSDAAVPCRSRPLQFGWIKSLHYLQNQHFFGDYTDIANHPGLQVTVYDLGRCRPVAYTTPLDFLVPLRYKRGFRNRGIFQELR
jgi:hypothetical protein